MRRFNGESKGKGVLIGAIAEVDHFYVKVEGIVNLIENLFTVSRYQAEVIEWIKIVQDGWFWLLGRVIVYQPAGHVGIERRRDSI